MKRILATIPGLLLLNFFILTLFLAGIYFYGDYFVGSQKLLSLAEQKIFIEANSLRSDFESLLQQKTEEAIWEDLANLYAREGVMEVFITDTKGTILFCHKQEYRGKQVWKYIPRLEQVEGYEKEEQGNATLYRNHKWTFMEMPVFLTTLEDGQTKVAAHIFVKWDYGNQKKRVFFLGLSKFLFGIFILLGVSILLYFFMKRSLSNPFQKLLENIRRLAEGEHELATYEGSIKEFSHIHENFSKMSKAVQISKDALKAERAIFEALFRLSSDKQDSLYLETLANQICKILSDEVFIRGVVIFEHVIKANKNSLSILGEHKGEFFDESEIKSLLKENMETIEKYGFVEIEIENQEDSAYYFFCTPVAGKTLFTLFLAKKLPSTKEVSKFFHALRNLLLLTFENFFTKQSRKRYENTVYEYGRILNYILKGQPLKSILEMISESLEKNIELPATVSILFVEKGTLRSAVVNKLPQEYNQIVEGIPIGLKQGSCGTAAFTGKVVISEDIETDENWQAYFDIVKAYGFSSVWSFPIKIRDRKEVVAVLALYFYEKRSPDRVSLAIINRYRRLMSIAIEHNYREKEIEKLAFYDVLTMLPNRAHLMEKFPTFMEHIKESKKQGALIFLDIDDFKDINDSEGHNIGDIVLQRFAEILNSTIRPPNFVARFGGDEFILILFDIGSTNEEIMRNLRTVAMRILHTLETPIKVKELIFRIRCSMGITLLTPENQNLEKLIQQADMALYQAKSLGKNQFSFYSEEIQNQFLADLEVEKNIRAGLNTNRFFVVYQPIVNTTGNVIGAEALLRLKDGEGNFVSPAAFIPVAERTGLIKDVANFLWHQVCLDYQTFMEKGLPWGFRISMNVSPIEMNQEDFEEKILREITDHGLSANQFSIEITEDLYMRNFQEAVRKLASLQREGFLIAIDDFGKGYSSLSYLKNMPVDKIKIDKLFVDNIDQVPKDKALVKAILDYAIETGLDVVIEGVETEVQFNLLKRLGATS
ncbi:MAG: EAL domain-containing protein, partial [Candidatus Hydrogenedentota bacterium]